MEQITYRIHEFGLAIDVATGLLGCAIELDQRSIANGVYVTFVHIVADNATRLTGGLHGFFDCEVDAEEERGLGNAS